MVESENSGSKIKIIFEFIGLNSAIFLSVITLIPFFEEQFELAILAQKSFSIILLLINSTLASILIVYYRTTLRKKPSLGEEELTGSLIESIEKAYNEEKWQKVIKIGSVLSRPLWLTGNYKIRVKIGELVESAAAFCKEDKVQATALIDDLGWTNVVLGNLEKAKSNIAHGIKIAESIEEYYLVSKAYRHLSGIAQKKRNYEEAKIMLQNAKASLQMIADGKEKEELNAGLLVNNALLEMDQGRCNEALSYLKTARETYSQIKDQDREVKIYSIEGNCHLKLGNIAEALDSFRDGLAIAEKRCRKDAILSNRFGIGRAYKTRKDSKRAKENFNIALDLAKEINDKTNINEIENELKNIDQG